MNPQKEHSKLPVINSEEMEIHQLPNKKVKIILPKMLRELQRIQTSNVMKNIGGKNIQEENEKLDKEAEDIKRTKKKF